MEKELENLVGKRVIVFVRHGSFRGKLRKDEPMIENGEIYPYVINTDDSTCVFDAQDIRSIEENVITLTGSFED